jgi:hypothetical protein
LFSQPVTVFYPMRLLFLPLLLSSLAAAQSKKQPTDHQLLQGTWVSTEDPRYTLRFTASQKLDFYSGESVGVASYRLRNDSLIAVDKADSTLFYYSLMSLTRRHLTLLSLGRGNLLTFRRRVQPKSRTEKLP